MTDWASLLKGFTEVPAPAGHEAALGEKVAELWGEHGPVETDSLGNVLMTLGTGSPHVALIAHLDELGIVVRKIESDGFLRVDRLGGLPERVLLMQQMLILGRQGPVPGVFGTTAHHFTAPERKNLLPPLEEAYIDIGAASAEDVRQLGVEVGTFGVYERRFRRQGDFVFANALDDRAGLAVLTELIGRLGGSPPTKLSFVASVQEEFSLRGMLPSIRRLSPDLIVTLDTAPACDTPDLRHRSDTGLGLGPGIGYYSFHGRGTLAGVIPPRWLTDSVEEVASANGIPFQRVTFFGGLTDGSFAQLEGAGAPALDIGIPTRYTHSPQEACSLADLENTCRLLDSWLSSDKLESTGRRA